MAHADREARAASQEWLSALASKDEPKVKLGASRCVWPTINPGVLPHEPPHQAVEKSAHLEWRLIPLPGYENEIKAVEIKKRLAQKMQGTESSALVRLLVFLVLGPTIRDCHFSHNVAVRREQIEEEISPA